MPRVPRYEPQVQARGLPLVEQSRIATSAPDGLEALGRGLQQAGAVLQQVETREQERADELRSEEAVNQLRERQLDLTFGQDGGYLNLKGRNALPQDGQALSQRYRQQFDQAANDIEASLGNDRQKRLYRQYANRTALEFQQGLMRHENGELDSWRRQTVQGVFAVEADSAARNWNNREAVDLSRQRIDINLARLRDADGLPADEVQRLRLDALSNLHSRVIDQAMTARDLAYADTYLKQYGDEIEAPTLLKARQLLTKEQDTQYAFGAARRAFQEAAQGVEPDDYTRLVGLVMGQESGGKRYGKDGQLLASAKGARGEMQVLDTTNLAPGFGVRPARDDSPDERARVGRDYLAAMLKRYGGNVAQALAAYNAGPGRVDAAIKSGGDWLARLPQETRDYVPAILNRYQAGGGAPARITLQDLGDTLRQDPRLADNPQRYNQAYEEVKRLYDEQDKARRTREDEAEGDLYRQLVANGGDFYAVPPQVRNAVNPTKLDTAISFAGKLRRGEEVQSDLRLYAKLASDPQFLRGLSESQFEALRSDLAPADFKHFSTERGKLLGQQVNKADDLNSQALNFVLNNRLQSLGIDPTPRDTDKTGMQRVGAIRQFITRALLDEQRQRGDRMGDSDVTQFVDRLFANSTELKRGLIFDTGGVPLLTIKPGEVPSEARDRIRQAFERAGREATDYDVLQVYWAQKFGNPRSPVKQAKPPAAAQPAGGSTGGPAAPARPYTGRGASGAF